MVAYGGQRTHDVSWEICAQGRLFIAGDADQNDRITAQTSFANTTPSIILSNPSGSGVVAMGMTVRLVQTGTVAGADVFVEFEAVTPTAYASGGTAEKAISAAIGLSSAPTEACVPYTGATATAGYGIKLYHYTLAPDVSPAEGVINVLEWNAPAGLWLWPNSSLNVFAYAGTTAPTLDWGVEWYEIPTRFVRRP